MFSFVTIFNGSDSQLTRRKIKFIINQKLVSFLSINMLW